MSRRAWILNIGLIAVLTAGTLKFRQDWRAFWPLHDVRSIRAAASVLPPLPAAPKSGDSSTAAWADILTHDPFSFDRNDIAIVVQEVQAKPLGPKPVLFGVMVIGADRSALVASGSNPMHSSRPLKIGDMIDGWTVTAIADKEIEVEGNGVRQPVVLNDPTAQIPRDNSRTAPGAAAPPPAQTSNPGAGRSIQYSPAGPPAPPAAAPGQPKSHYELTPFGTYRLVPDPQRQ